MKPAPDQQGPKTLPNSEKSPRAEEPLERWDVFISHASEDKADFVEPLASALAAFGVRVWYDAYTLSVGDSLSRSIDQGLARSNFGLVVLSPAFIAKRWPEYELRGLTAREISAGKVVLPIWHSITHESVLNFSPPLADKVAIKSDGLSPVQIAVQIIETIRPDVFTRILRRLAHYSSLENAKTEKVDLRKLRPGPIRHESIPPELVGRIRLVRAALLRVYPHSMSFWLDGFKRDTHPSDEIAYWEHVAAVFLEYAAMTPRLTQSQAKRIFQLILTLGIDDDAVAMQSQETAKKARGFAKKEIEKLKTLYGHLEPAYDFDEGPPFEETDTQDVKKRLADYDTEHFPSDLPEALIRDLLGTQKNRPRQRR
jgi:hypothetical protein